MKKLLFVFLIFLVLFFNVPPSFAADPITVPTCDPTKVLIDNRTANSFYSNFGKNNYIFVAFPSPPPIFYDSSYPTQAGYNDAAASCASAPKFSGGGHAVTGYSFCDATPLIYEANGTFSGCWPVVDAGAVNTLTEKSIEIPNPQYPCPFGCQLSGSACEISGKPGIACNLLPAGKTFDCPAGYDLNPATGKCFLLSGKTVPGAAPTTGTNIKVHLCIPSDGTCDTALGKIPLEPGRFIEMLLRMLIAVSGLVILIMLIVAGYNVATSEGDPQKLAGAKEMIISIIAGTVLIFFSLVLLKAISVDILGLPPFTQIVGVI